MPNMTQDRDHIPELAETWTHELRRNEHVRAPFETDEQRELYRRAGRKAVLTRTETATPPDTLTTRRQVNTSTPRQPKGPEHPRTAPTTPEPARTTQATAYGIVESLACRALMLLEDPDTPRLKTTRPSAPSRSRAPRRGRTAAQAGAHERRCRTLLRTHPPQPRAVNPPSTGAHGWKR
ncbi:hypothetical protein GCM10009780_13680 [Actinomadura alba]